MECLFLGQAFGALSALLRTFRHFLELLRANICCYLAPLWPALFLTFWRFGGSKRSLLPLALFGAYGHILDNWKADEKGLSFAPEISSHYEMKVNFLSHCEVTIISSLLSQFCGSDENPGWSCCEKLSELAVLEGEEPGVATEKGVEKYLWRPFPLCRKRAQHKHICLPLSFSLLAPLLPSFRIRETKNIQYIGRVGICNPLEKF